MDIFEKSGIKAAGAEIYQAGSGLADDMIFDNSENCLTAVLRGIDEAEFSALCENLEACGLTVSFENSSDSLICLEFYEAGFIVYAYYTYADSTARFIYDVVSSPLFEFSSHAGEEKFADTCLVQYGLTYGPMKRGTTADCGMNYVIRLRDGRLIIIDGGESEQSTDAAIEDFASMLREITGSEKITIALWFCTHAHNDHMDFFLKYLRLHRQTVSLERVMFNFPSARYIDLMQSNTLMRERLKNYYPDAAFLKPHTGERFNIGGCMVEILLTHEDMMPMSDEKMYRGMNETSTVAKFTFDGCSLLILADIPDPNGIKLTQVYEKNPLECTFLQAAHHMINKVEEVYKNTKADYILIPRWDKTLSGENYDVLCKYYNSENFIAAGAGTARFFVSDGEIKQIKRFAPLNIEYDNSSI